MTPDIHQGGRTGCENKTTQESDHGRNGPRQTNQTRPSLDEERETVSQERDSPPAQSWNCKAMQTSECHSDETDRHTNLDLSVSGFSFKVRSGCFARMDQRASHQTREDGHDSLDPSRRLPIVDDQRMCEG